MSEWYVMCLDVSEGQVRTSPVRIGKVRTGQSKGRSRQMSGGCLAGVLRVFVGCLKGVWRVS